jgi:hypothetical protein
MPRFVLTAVLALVAIVTLVLATGSAETKQECVIADYASEDGDLSATLVPRDSRELCWVSCKLEVISRDKGCLPEVIYTVTVDSSTHGRPVLIPWWFPASGGTDAGSQYFAPDGS